MDCVREWFAFEGWVPFPFQEEVWQAYLSGESGLIHAASGTGKTYAAWLGPILEWMTNYGAGERPRGPSAQRAPAPLTALWITPLRALAADTQDALRAPIEDLGLPWTVESRTGDTAPESGPARASGSLPHWSPPLRAWRCCSPGPTRPASSKTSSWW